MNSVIILSPSNYSIYSIMVTEQLINEGINVERLVVKRLFNWQRVLSEMKYGRKRFIRKILNKLFFRGASKDIPYRHTLAKKFAEGNYQFKSLSELSNVNNIPISFCDDFHSNSILSEISQSKPTLIVFTGGGIIRRSLLDLPSKGVLNCHMGILPEYRGMDCYIWAILNNEPNKIGLTTHLMDSGIDTGPILDTFAIETNEISSIRYIEAELEANMPDFMVRSTIDLLLDRKAPLTQLRSQGKQYFIPSETLVQHAEKLVANKERSRLKHELHDLR